jgi:hypothetical protein
LLTNKSKTIDCANNIFHNFQITILLRITRAANK